MTQLELFQTYFGFRLRCMNAGVDISSLTRSGSMFNCLDNLIASRFLS